MDVARPIIYRGFTFNDAPLTVTGPRSVGGCTVRNVRLGGVEIVGYTEKRAMGEGKDASDVYKGGYRFPVEGTIYGTSRGDLYDRLHAMEMAIDPASAQRDRPDVQGYCPLTFYEPSEGSEWANGVIPLFMGARAVSGVVRAISSDGSGVDDSDAIALPYTVTFEAKDPRRYVTTRQVYRIGGAGGNLVFSNRGALHVPLNMLLVMDPQPSADRVFSMVFPGSGGASFDINVKAGSDTLVVRVDGEKRVVTLQAGDREVPAMNLCNPNANWPVLPPGDVAASWVFKRDNGDNANMRDDSVLFFREAFP